MGNACCYPWRSTYILLYIGRVGAKNSIYDMGDLGPRRDGVVEEERLYSVIDIQYFPVGWSNMERSARSTKNRATRVELKKLANP